MKWTLEQIKELKEKYSYYLEHNNEAEEYFQKSWCSIKSKASTMEITSMKINKKCSLFLGCNVAERILSHVFKDVEKMPIHNKGFDFICNKGFKIDSKASCLHKYNNYVFVINRNKIADYFLLIGFDNREDLNPQHVWLIKGDEIIKYYGKFNKNVNKNGICKKLNEFNDIVIVNTHNSLYSYDLSNFSKYELTDKLKETITCCDTLKNNKGEDL